MIKVEGKQLASLIEEIKIGNKQAFKEFFVQFQPSIFYFLFKFTSDKDASADLTQDTFIKFWQYREKLDENSSPKAYLFKIARNLAINHITRKPPIDYSEDRLVSYIQNPEKEYDGAFLMDDFHKAVNLLPERCKATFILSRYEGMSYTEIAEILTVSLQTVKNQMSKAISFLRKYLEQHLE